MMPSVPRVDADLTIHDYIPGQPIPAMIKDRRTGQAIINELKRYVRPFTLVIEPKELVLDPGGTTLPIPMTIDDTGHFEIMRAFFQSQRAEGFTVLIQDPDERPILMNKEVHVATIASGGGVTTGVEVLGTDGSAGRPFVWPESFWMDSSRAGKAVHVVFRNLSNQFNVIRFALHGLRWYHMQAPAAIANRMHDIYRTRFRSMPFFYTTDRDAILNLTTGVIITDTFIDREIRFGDEAWTEIVKAMAVTVPTGQAYRVRIREKAQGKRYMEQMLLNSLVFGNGELPFLYWESSLFQPGVKLAIELQAPDVGVPQFEVWLTFACRKIFWDPREDKLARP